MLLQELISENSINILQLRSVYYYIQDFYGKSGIQKKEDSFHQQIGLTFMEETSEILYLEHSSVWC